MTTHVLPQGLKRLLPVYSDVDVDGGLTVGGCNVRDLADRFHTPLYIYDEDGLRETMRRYQTGLAERWPNSRVCFASKAFPSVAAYALAAEEGLSVDVVGEGELRLALAAGVDPRRILLHGNAKGADEIALSIQHGVGLIVVDNWNDIALIEQATALHEQNVQNILIRVVPNILTNTHPSIQTGGAESKFGLPATEVVKMIKELAQHPTIHVSGIHLHIGSQIHELQPFADSVHVLSLFPDCEVYNIGGGLGVNYSDEDNAPDVENYLDAITAVANEQLPKHAELLIEPGRSLVARAGITAYRVRNVKHTAHTFVAVDGGMSDQMNITLTNEKFTGLVADRVTAAQDTEAQIVGRQCESGDLLVDRAQLQQPQLGDTLVLAATGAYGYTFVNNYNGALHPAVVFCSQGKARVVVRRQTYDDLLSPHMYERKPRGEEVMQ